MHLYWSFCVFFSGIAMYMDVKWEKVCNMWIIGGWGFGLALRLVFYETGEGYTILTGMFLPLLLLFPLFFCKMIGTGDIKVFMVLGTVLGGKQILEILVCSFLIGAGIALPILIFRCNWRERLIYFWKYVEQCLQTHTFSAYLVSGKRPENIHFTIPIFCSVLLFALGGAR